MYTYDSCEHDLICMYCGVSVLCEDMECYLPALHEGICEECLYYERHGMFDDYKYLIIGGAV